ncbi:MAG: class I SAM-dependent methyltransferase [Pseudomonadota bacterium]
MDKAEIKRFSGRVFDDISASMMVGLAYIGVKAGLFKGLEKIGPAKASALAAACGLQERYVLEWAKGMTAGGYIEHDPAADTYHLSDEHAYLLASQGTDHFVGGMFLNSIACLGVAPDVLECFSAGGGVPFEAFGPCCIEACDLASRGIYEARLASYWLPQMPEVIEKLERGGRVLDFGCGSGVAATVIAQAFPAAHVVGLDVDESSIERARELAKDASAKPEFVRVSSSDYEPDDGFDLIMAGDSVHDLAQPRETLADIRRLLKPDGTFFIIEPRAGDTLADNTNPVGAMFYGFSVFHCMTQSLARDGAGLGACLGPAAIESLVKEAGFSQFEVLDIKSPVNIFCAARP